MAEDSDDEIVLSPKLESLSEEHAKDPTSKKFYPLAEEYRKSGMLDEAIYICNEGLKNHPGYLPAQMTLAHCYVETKNYIEGQLLLQEILERKPGSAPALRLAGDLYFSQGEIDSAREHYLAAQKLLPDDRVIDERLQMIDFPEKDLASDREIDVSEVESAEEPKAAAGEAPAAEVPPGLELSGAEDGDEGELELDLDEVDEPTDVVLTLGDEAESVDLFVPTQKRVAVVEEPLAPEPSAAESQDEISALEIGPADRSPAEEADEAVAEEEAEVGALIEVGDPAAAAFAEPAGDEEDGGEPLLPQEEIEPLEIPQLETSGVAEADSDPTLESPSEITVRFASPPLQEVREEDIGVPEEAERELPADATALVLELESLSPEELQEVPPEELVLGEGDIVERGVAPAVEAETEAEPAEAREEEVPAEVSEPPAVEEPFFIEPMEIGDLGVGEPVAAEPATPEIEEELPAPPTITSAKIYEEQGHPAEALEIYRWLLERDPDYKHLEDKVRELERDLELAEASSVDGSPRRDVATLRRWLRNIEAFDGGRDVEDA